MCPLSIFFFSFLHPCLLNKLLLIYLFYLLFFSPLLFLPLPLGLALLISHLHFLLFSPFPPLLSSLCLSSFTIPSFLLGNRLLFSLLQTYLLLFSFSSSPCFLRFSCHLHILFLLIISHLLRLREPSRQTDGGTATHLTFSRPNIVQRHRTLPSSYGDAVTAVAVANHIEPAEVEDAHTHTQKGRFENTHLLFTHGLTQLPPG